MDVSNHVTRTLCSGRGDERQLKSDSLVSLDHRANSTPTVIADKYPKVFRSTYYNNCSVIFNNFFQTFVAKQNSLCLPPTIILNT